MLPAQSYQALHLGAEAKVVETPFKALGNRPDWGKGAEGRDVPASAYHSGEGGMLALPCQEGGACQAALPGSIMC